MVDLLSTRHYLGAMRLLQILRESEKIWEHIQIYLIVREDDFAVIWTKENKI